MGRKCVYVYTCDRCGKKFGEVKQGAPITARIRERKRIENGVKGFLTIHFWYCYYDDERYELCDDCMKSLKAWFSNPGLDKQTSELSDEAKEIYDDMLDKLGKK